MCAFFHFSLFKNASLNEIPCTLYGSGIQPGVREDILGGT